MGQRFDDSITVLAAGASIAATSSSARVPIPVCLSGEIPRYIRIGSTAAACIRLGTVTVTASTSDAQIQPGDATVFHVPSGITHMAAVQVTTGGQVQISALENM